MADTEDLKSSDREIIKVRVLSPGPKYKRQHWQYNRCSYCGKFKAWKDLALSFIPDTLFSSESESTQGCYECLNKS